MEGMQEALEYVVSLGEKQIQNAHGRAYARDPDGDLQEVPSPASLPAPLEMSSLRSLVEYVASRFDDDCEDGSRIDSKRVAMIVDGPERVRLVGPLFGEFNQREVIAVCEPYLATGFPYGRYLDIEEFITQLQACFVDTPMRGEILKVVGNIIDENVKTVVDDGISQSVTARTGIVKREEVKLPNPVDLRPFRTFPEIVQPQSLFVLRVRKTREGQLPGAGLFETADLNWKHVAAGDIRTELKGLLEAAGVKVPVFA